MKKLFMLSLFVALGLLLAMAIQYAQSAPAESYDDCVGSPDASDEEFVQSLFRCILGREPNAAELHYKVNLLRSGKSREKLIRKLFFSSGYPIKRKNNEDFIRDLFQAILGREPDFSEWDHWVGRLESGTSRQETLSMLFGSSEYKSIVANRPSQKSPEEWGFASEDAKKALKNRVNGLCAEWYEIREDADGAYQQNVTKNCRALRHNALTATTSDHFALVEQLIDCSDECYKTSAESIIELNDCVDKCREEYNKGQSGP